MAHVQIRRSLAVARDEATRAGLERQAAAARDTLLATARRSSRLVILIERRRDYETAPAVQTARLVAREGRVTLQALAGPRPQSPDWERAGVVEADAYLAVLDRLLRDPALAGDWPAPRFDANAPGPRRAIVVRLAIGEDERELQALAGAPYERLAALAGPLWSSAAPCRCARPPDPMAGTLYVVATPLGNLEDITLRALRVLKEVALIACEDTRRTRILLTHFGIHAPVTSYFEHNKLRKAARLLETLQAGQSVALVTDAGTPGISDPGFLLVKQAREAGIPVVPVPGPSAVVAALSAAGVPADRFLFEGFLPVKPGRRVHRLEALRDLELTVVCYESPHRILASLEAIAQVFGEREIVVAREMTKTFEEIVRGPAAALRERFAGGTARGEFTVIIPAPSRAPAAPLD